MSPAGAAALLLALAVAQTVPSAPDAAPAPKANPRLVPMPAPRHPEYVRGGPRGSIDIPQSAKNAGHNGSATHQVTIGADGAILSITLKRSSRSDAIDAAAMAAAKAAWYSPATDPSGKPVSGTIEVRSEYARWDDESPGGGLDTYRCADLVREYDWFIAAHKATGDRLFWLQNAYVGRLMLANQAGVDPRDRAAIARQRSGYEKKWQAIVKQCRKRPEALMLDLVDDAPAYRGMVESF
jgi:TonB family protein